MLLALLIPRVLEKPDVLDGLPPVPCGVIPDALLFPPIARAKLWGAWEWAALENAPIHCST